MRVDEVFGLAQRERGRDLKRDWLGPVLANIVNRHFDLQATGEEMGRRIEGEGDVGEGK